jgi:hypothetical protein
MESENFSKEQIDWLICSLEITMQDSEEINCEDESKLIEIQRKLSNLKKEMKD